MNNFSVLHIKFVKMPSHLKDEILEWFSSEKVKVIDVVTIPEQESTIFSFLGDFSLLLEDLIRFPMKYNQIVQKYLYSISFNPLRLAELSDLVVYLRKNIQRLNNTIQHPFIYLGYLKHLKSPRYIIFSPEELQKIDFVHNPKYSKYIQVGKSYLPKRPIFVGVKPYSILIFIKAAIEDVKGLRIIKSKVGDFFKHPKISNSPLVKFSYVTNEAMTIAKIGLKIIDYYKYPVHKVMIYIYDLFEKHGIVPVEAEFGYPIPRDVIKNAMEDLFTKQDKDVPPSTEILKTLNLFRFNIETIFEYPSYILEKRFELI